MRRPSPRTPCIVWAVAAGLFAATLAEAQQVPWPTAGWSVSTPAAQGLDPAPLRALHEAFAEGTYGYVDRLVVIRNGLLVVDHRYERDYRAISRGFSGALGCGFASCGAGVAIDEYNYYHPDRHPYYRGRDVHSLQSVTKSIAATVVGIAVARGDIEGADTPLLALLADYDLSRVDARLHRATLADLLTMRSGIEWHETDRPLDSTNTTLLLERSDDWVQFTLDQPLDADPGTKWAYSSGGSHLMSAVVRSATGRLIDAYAEEYLFRPLGIHDYHWKLTPTGLPDAEGGLYLEAAQLAKIGYLYLRDGIWDGTRILPEGWVGEATRRTVDSVNTLGWGYGYQWWRLDREDVAVWAGLGFGGQFLIVLPEFDLIAVVNSWNIFGGRFPSTLGALLDAVVAALPR